MVLCNTPHLHPWPSPHPLLPSITGVESLTAFQRNGPTVSEKMDSLWDYSLTMCDPGIRPKAYNKTGRGVTESGTHTEWALVTRQLGQCRAVFGFPGPGIFISSNRPSLSLLGDADAEANAGTAVQPTRRDVLLINVIPEEETHLLSEKHGK